MRSLPASLLPLDFEAVDSEGLRDILIALNSDRSLSEVLAYIAARAALLLEADACVLYRLAETEGAVLIEARHGLPEQFLTVPALPLGAELGNQVLLNCTPTVLTAGDDFAAGEWGAALAAHYCAALLVPLMVKGELYGSLAFYYTEPWTPEPEDVRLGVLLGSHAALAIENTRLRVQAEQAAVLQERNRLARDLHDSVTQSLYSLTMLAEAARRLAEAGELARVEDAIGRLGEISQQALKEMRLLVYELRPLALKRVGLVGALQQRIDTVERRAGVEARLLVSGDVQLAPAVEEDLYHIVQEALNNALKHAAATSVTVQVQCAAAEVWIEVTDNGRGFVTQTEAGGMGLESMRERAVKLGATLAVDSEPGGGTTVRVALRGGVDGGA